MGGPVDEVRESHKTSVGRGAFICWPGRVADGAYMYCVMIDPLAKSIGHLMHKRCVKQAAAAAVPLASKRAPLKMLYGSVGTRLMADQRAAVRQVSKPTRTRLARA